MFPSKNTMFQAASAREDRARTAEEKIDELQRANTFSRPSELSATGAADKNTQPGRGRKKDDASTKKRKPRDG